MNYSEGGQTTESVLASEVEKLEMAVRVYQ